MMQREIAAVVEELDHLMLGKEGGEIVEAIAETEVGREMVVTVVNEKQEGGILTSGPVVKKNSSHNS